MTPLEMITEWRKGCSCALPPDHPVKCHECTVGLIDALEHALKKEMWQSIETAPKNNTEILIFTHGLIRIGFFDTARGGVWSVWPGRATAWPTHWMPLPHQ